MTTITNLVLCTFTITSGVVTNEVIFSDGTKDKCIRESFAVNEINPLSTDVFLYDEDDKVLRPITKVGNYRPLSTASKYWRETPIVLSDEDIVRLCSSIVSVAGEDTRNWADAIPLRHEGKTIGFISKEAFLKAFKNTLNYRASAIFRGFLNTKGKEEK